MLYITPHTINTVFDKEVFKYSFPYQVNYLDPIIEHVYIDVDEDTFLDNWCTHGSDLGNMRLPFPNISSNGIGFPWRTQEIRYSVAGQSIH